MPNEMLEKRRHMAAKEIIKNATEYVVQESPAQKKFEVAIINSPLKVVVQFAIICQPDIDEKLLADLTVAAAEYVRDSAEIIREANDRLNEPVPTDLPLVE